MTWKKRVPGANLYLHLKVGDKIIFEIGGENVVCTYPERNGNTVCLAVEADRKVIVKRDKTGRVTPLESPGKDPK